MLQRRAAREWSAVTAVDLLSAFRGGVPAGGRNCSAPRSALTGTGWHFRSTAILHTHGTAHEQVLVQQRSQQVSRLNPCLEDLGTRRALGDLRR